MNNFNTKLIRIVKKSQIFAEFFTLLIYNTKFKNCNKFEKDYIVSILVFKDTLCIYFFLTTHRYL